MAMITVRIGDCQWSSDPGAALITYSLGSCIAVCVYDPAARIGGMLHYMLPDSSIAGPERELSPYRFADTGIPRLFQRMFHLGAEKSRLVVRVAGGAQIMTEHCDRKIGKNNYLALRRILWKAGILVHGEAVGGTAARTVVMEIGTGRLLVRGPSGEIELPVRRGQNGVHRTDCG
jgi:chemotaxis protein CheD